MVGCADGAKVGISLGTPVCMVGTAPAGAWLGIDAGNADGGSSDGSVEGISAGMKAVGADEMDNVGALGGDPAGDGTAVISSLGTALGTSLGTAVGNAVGLRDRLRLRVGWTVGISEGMLTVGADEMDSVGALGGLLGLRGLRLRVGLAVGPVGLTVGISLGM